jgi:hypothetical protein
MSKASKIIDFRVTKYTPEIAQFIRENYPDKGVEYCAEKLGENFTASSIYGYCFNKGIQRTPTCDVEFFKNPSTPEMAYYLGLIWGDGGLDTTKISLKVVKEDGLEFYNIIKGLANFKVYEIKREDRRVALNIVLGNTKLVKYLTEMDYRQKSLVSPTKILSTIPDELKRFFWLGLADADGSFFFSVKNRQNGFSVSGPIDQDWSDLKATMTMLGCESTIVKRQNSPKGHKDSYIRISSKYDVVHFGQYLYQSYKEDSIGLKRKYEKFLMIKDRFHSTRLNKLGLIGVTEKIDSKGHVSYVAQFYVRGVEFLFFRGFQSKEGAILFYDNLSVFYYAHHAKTNYPIENYFRLGMTDNKIEDPRLKLDFYKSKI